MYNRTINHACTALYLFGFDGDCLSTMGSAMGQQFEIVLFQKCCTVLCKVAKEKPIGDNGGF